jgi:hypothetical protein
MTKFPPVSASVIARIEKQLIAFYSEETPPADEIVVTDIQVAMQHKVGYARLKFISKLKSGDKVHTANVKFYLTAGLDVNTKTISAA